MDFNLLARVAKLAALFGFFLPWVTVSCSGTEIAQATGWQLITGDIEAAEGMGEPDQAGPAVLVVAAFAVVALGLLLGVLTKGRAAAATMLIAAAIGIGLSFFSIETMRAEMVSSMAQSQDDFAQAARAAIKLDKQEGFWISVGAMAAAALFCLLMLATRAPAAAPERRD